MPATIPRMVDCIVHAPSNTASSVVMGVARGSVRVRVGPVLRIPVEPRVDPVRDVSSIGVGSRLPLDLFKDMCASSNEVLRLRDDSAVMDTRGCEDTRDVRSATLV